MSKIKLGVSYNVFDGFELLKDSILQIREYVDYISVVYQDISNWGNNIHPIQKIVLDELLNEGLIDELKHYTPNLKINSKSNELDKRNIGLKLSRINNCTHHMTMDCDEFYVKDDFKKYTEWISKNPDILAYAHFIDYYKSPNVKRNTIVTNIKATKITLFCPISNKNIRFSSKNSIRKYIVDPTRSFEYSNYTMMDENMIIMHHMTMIRADISVKIMNTGKKQNMTDSKIKEIIDIYNNLDLTNDDTFNATKYGTLIKTEPLFELKNFYSLCEKMK